MSKNILGDITVNDFLMRAKDGYSKLQRYMAIIGFLSTFIIGGLVGINIALMVRGSLPGAIGEITTVEEIDVGMWFRYDLSTDRYYGTQTLANWTAEGGKPYIIVECINKTTWDEIGDYRTEGINKIAYDWNITVFWKSGAQAIELENGSLDNDQYKFMMKTLKDAWNNRSEESDIPIYNLFRPHIDPSLEAFNGAQPNQYAFMISMINLGKIKNAIDIGTTPIGWKNDFYTGKFLEIGGTHNADHFYSYEAYYDPDSGLLWYLSITDYYRIQEGGARMGINHFLYLSAYGIKELEEDPPSIGTPIVIPDAPDFFVVESNNVSYEYELEISGEFDLAYINITSNDTNAFSNVNNATITSNTFPLDINDEVQLNISIAVNVSSAVSNVTTRIFTLDKVNVGNQIENVTLLSVIQIGNSINITWTENENASQYRIFINGTYFGEPYIGTKAFIQPPVNQSAFLNITVVADSKKHNISSNHSNGIVVNYTVTGDDSPNTEEKTETIENEIIIKKGITPEQIITNMVVIFIIAGVAVVIVFYSRYRTRNSDDRREIVSEPRPSRR